MAEGGGYENPGFDEGEPVMEPTDDRDDDGDTTTAFEPNGASTPGPSGQDILMTTRTNLPPARGPGTAETSFIEGLPTGRVLNPDSLKIELAKQTLTRKYPGYGKDGKF